MWNAMIRYYVVHWNHIEEYFCALLNLHSFAVNVTISSGQMSLHDPNRTYFRMAAGAIQYADTLTTQSEHRLCSLRSIHFIA